MNLFDHIISILAPHECLACGAEGQLVCTSCVGLFPDLTERCHRCLEASPGSMTCVGCRKASPLRYVRAATEYEGIARDLIWKLKFAGGRSAVKQMASVMLPLLIAMKTDDTVLVPVPTATSRVRQRGYDQAKLLAREMARLTRLPYAECLVRTGQSHQVGASRVARNRQLQNAFRPAKQRWIKGAHIILIDDVTTTGATLEAAAKVLLHAGARQIDAVTFAQA